MFTPRFSLVVIALCLGLSSAALADPGHGKGHGKHWKQEKHGSFKGCPPGLAKKNNGCRPPGQAKKYIVGQPLPADVVWHPVPGHILADLQPAPIGYRYVEVDQDVLLISEASKKVIDAVMLASAAR